MTPPRPTELTQSLKACAAQEGFFLVGAAPAITPPHYDFFCQWLDQGLAGTMDYLPRRRSAYAHPRSILDHARSVLMLGASYFRASPVGETPMAPPLGPSGRGRIARYAWSGHDYHDWIHARLKRLVQAVRQRWPGLNLRGVVDTAPLLERDFARLAGLGWVGKNTMLINKRAGSYFFLAALILDTELEYDQPHAADHCGTCTRCLEACPTQAFPAPGVLDARRCISYLTIEHHGAVAPELRSGLGDWWFGCDICQEVCPWNRHAGAASSAAEDSESQTEVELVGLFSLSESEFRQRFRRTPMWRSKRSGALRNAAYVLGNQRAAAALPTLVAALETEPDPIVRGAIAWALGQFGSPHLLAVLQARLSAERDPDVQAELHAALANHPRKPGGMQI
jgi:epoxyqueuosine reductase